MAKKSAKSAPKKAITSSDVADTSTWDVVQDNRRVKDVPSALKLYSRLVNDNVKRSAIFAEVRNAFDGARPMNQTSLESQGNGWQANFNTGDARALLERASKPYNTLVESQPTRISVTIHEGVPHRQKYEAAFAKNFDRFIDDWGQDYKVNWQLMSQNHIMYGPGLVLWPFDDCPRFAAPNVQRVYFPKNARMSPDSWDVVCMVRDVSASELYLKVRDEKSEGTSKAAGWNTEALKKAIYHSLYGNQRRDYRDYTRWMDDIVQNDVVISSIHEPLQLAWLYVRQFDGSIGCYVFEISGANEEFLFSSEKYAEKWQHIIGCAWYDTGQDSLVHSIKGFGIKNYPYIQAISRLKLRMVDSAAMAFSLNFQYGDGIPADSPPIANYGPVNMFPAGIQQMQYYPQVQQGIAVMEILSQNQAENNAMYRQQVNTQIAESQTARQATILASQAGELTESSAALFLSQVSGNIFTEIVRRLRKKGSLDADAKAFQRRMREDGVPDEIIFKAEIRVQCSASAGIASAMVREQRAQQMLSLSNMPGINQRYWLEQYIAYTWGSNAVEKGMLPEGQNSAPYERKMAMIENAQFGQGLQLPVDQGEAHFEHCEEHLKPLMQIAGQYMQTQQVTPEAQTALVIGIMHTSQHIEFLKQDSTAKEKYQQVWPVFSQVQSVARGILTQMQKQQNEAQAGGMAPQGAPPGPAMGLPMPGAGM